MFKKRILYSLQVDMAQHSGNRPKIPGKKRLALFANHGWILRACQDIPGVWLKFLSRF